MGNEIKISANNLNNISACLDTASAKLSVEEKGLLASVFQAAAVQVHGEVQGFAYVGAAAGANVNTPNLGAAFQGIFGAVGGVVGAAASTAGGVGASAGAAAGGGGAGVAAGGGGGGLGISLPAVGVQGAVYVVI